MPTVKLDATEMADADVLYISLVDRGANRIPFKVIKQESNMAGHYTGLDLSSLFRTQKSDQSPDPAPTAQVLGVVTMKGEQYESVKGAVEAAGFSVADEQELEDGSVIFKQETADVQPHELTIVKLNDQVALVTKGFSPYSMEMELGSGVSFADAVTASGFYPSIRTVTEVLGSGVNTLVVSAPTPAEAAKSIAKMFDEAKQYVVSLVGGLPVKAFKMDATVAEAVATKNDPEPAEDGDQGGDDGDQEAVAKAAKKKPFPPAADGDPADDEAAPGDGKADAAMTDKKKKQPACKNDGEPGDDSSDEDEAGDAGEGLTKELVTSIVSAQISTVVDALTQKMDTLVASLNTATTTIKGDLEGSLTAKLGEVASAISTLTDRVNKAEETVQAAQDAVTGTVVSGSESGDAVPLTVVKGAGQGQAGREIDTAFMPTVRKRSSR